MAATVIHRRRWFQFGLASLLVAMAVIAVSIALFRESALEKTLDGKTNVKFSRTTIRQAIDFVAHKHKIAWTVDETALTQAGLSLDTLSVTGSASGKSLREALHDFLDPLGLGFRVKYEQLVITTAAKGEQ